MNEDRSIWWWVLLGAALIAAAVGGYLWWQQRGMPMSRPVATTQPAPAPAPSPLPPAAKPPIEHPIEQAPVAAQAETKAQLPALDNSDTAVRESLAGLVGATRLNSTMLMQNIVHRIVATVDNLPREKLSQKIVPYRNAEGPLRIAGEGEQRTIAPDNVARYAPYMALVRSTDPKQLAALYAKYYPLFQQAYQDLGYPQGYFNDRLVEVIDHLLAAPEIADARLNQPKVLYEYADPSLESRSAGQKILMRIGPEHAREVKAKLREIRREITRQPPTVAAKGN